jgi:tetratricopeptide (TPR) repeat protein
MLAYERLNDYKSALAAGRTALQLAPNNLHVLATLANIIANGARPGNADDPLLEESSRYARNVLHGIAVQKIPPSLPMTEWNEIKLRLETSARSALGLVMLRRGQTADAIRELEWVTRHGAETEGVAFLRLGSAYLQAKDDCGAARAFERALELGPDLVRERAAAARKSVSGCPDSPGKSR